MTDQKTNTDKKHIPVITLTTDLGNKDYYVSAVKAAIISQLSPVHIVDISHDIIKFNLAQAAFVLKNVACEFPQGTVHIIGVLPDASGESPHIAVKYERQYYIGADNGIFSLIFDHKPDQIVELTIKQDTDFMTFPTKDVFVKAACHLARGGTLEVLGGPRDNFLEKTSLKPITDKNRIKGQVIYVDHYGNLITNIPHSIFKEVGKGRKFTISMKNSIEEIKTLSKNYNDVGYSELLALFGATGHLEIAINIGEASKLLNMHIGESVSIEFYDHKNR